MSQPKTQPTATLERPQIGITIGDLNGVGPEVIMKTFMDKRMYDRCTPVIYGSARVISYHRKVLGFDSFEYHAVGDAGRAKAGNFNLINCWTEETQLNLGESSKSLGRFALRALESATYDLKEGKIDALVTAPVNKNNINNQETPFFGHTEYLTEKFEAGQSVMLLCSEHMRMGLVTNHLPVAKVAAAITPELIVEKLKVLEKGLKEDFGIEKPKIAVFGLNPHAGDGGLIGEEEHKVIMPAIQYAKEKMDSMVFGPFAADGFFGRAMYKDFDAILAMYHDQGLVPFKALSFGDGVNVTLGLPVIRTSPDHGTAFDIAGKGIASPESFRQAIYQAIDLWRERKNYMEMSANPLEKGRIHQHDDRG